MIKYKIYFKNKLETEIKADYFEANYEWKKISFYKNNDCIAVFNFENIVGIKEVKNQ